MQNLNRRQFMEFFGTGTLALLAGCSTFLKKGPPIPGTQAIPSILPSSEDKVVLADGLEENLLIKWGDPINSLGDTFGFNNDYTAFIPLSENRAILWVNHEYASPMFVSNFVQGQERTLAQVDLEMYNCGGSILSIVRSSQGGPWEFDLAGAYNKRLTAKTPIPIIGPRGEKVTMAYGTLGNCAGGLTPWKTVLTCEENYQDCFGDRDFLSGKFTPSTLGWEKFYPYPSENYGWVVEVNPLTGSARKLMSMGRFAHECATVSPLPDGRVVVYTGDDKENECLYKFISKKPGSLEQGELFVADMDKGRWISMDRQKHRVLKKHFKSQKEVLTYSRAAAKMVGGSPLDRPEDIKIHPASKAVFVTLTNSLSKRNFFGHILKLEEEGGRPDAMNFQHSYFAVGGEEGGFACPDNLAFDRKGNLWMTSDMSGSVMNKDPYATFKNNGLFYFPTSGPEAGRAFQLASGPVHSELTGMSFSHDHRTLFLSVQHPGEYSPSLDKLTSHWPLGGGEIPRPGIIQIQGRTLDNLLG